MKKEMHQIPLRAITIYTMRLSRLMVPNSQATRSKSKMPTRPQLMHPTMLKINAKMSIKIANLLDYA